jgi:transcriptional regulator with XRE-family HTH domain
MDFTRKKVESLTLGERLRKIRSDHRMSLIEVSRATKIQVKYLEAIECGEYEKLPAEVYVKGFLKSYAGFLGVPEDAILKLYDRECHIRTNLGKGEAPRFQPKIPTALSFSVTPRMFFSGAIMLVVFGFFLYLYSEFSAFVSVPRLVILEPADGTSVKVGEIRIKGETDIRAKVTINSGDVIVDEKGAFEEMLRLQPGANTLLISSTNRFGKMRQVRVMVEGDFEQSKEMPENIPAPENQTFSLSVRADGKDILVSVQADGSVIFSGLMKEGEEKRFDARELFSVSSNDGKSTMVKFGENPEEALSDKAGMGEASFTKEGRRQ